jgi:hypothetical protein
MPSWLKHATTDLIALLVYLPLAKLSLLADRMGFNVTSIPLYYYRNHGFYTMRTDARDRFGTPLEQRFTRSKIAEMMNSAGLVDARFLEAAPYWCAVGFKEQLSH